MDIALSDHDIMQLIDYKANLMTYAELQRYNSIEKAMGPHRALVLLYETKDNFGHWTCVFFAEDNLIEHFDSYGLFPDDELKFIPEYYRVQNYEKIPHLTYLLYKSKNRVLYNEYKLQKKAKGINTCGRWVSARLINRHIPQQEFAKYFLSFDDPDQAVTDYTNNLLTI